MEEKLEEEKKKDIEIKIPKLPTINLDKEITLRKLLSILGIYTFLIFVAIQFIFIPELNGQLKNIMTNTSDAINNKLNSLDDQIYQLNIKYQLTERNVNENLLGLLIYNNPDLTFKHMEFENKLNSGLITINQTCLPNDAPRRFYYDSNPTTGNITRIQVIFYNDKMPYDRIASYEVTSQNAILKLEMCNLNYTV